MCNVGIGGDRILIEPGGQVSMDSTWPPGKKLEIVKCPHIGTPDHDAWSGWCKKCGRQVTVGSRFDHTGCWA